MSALLTAQVLKKKMIPFIFFTCFMLIRVDQGAGAFLSYHTEKLHPRKTVSPSQGQEQDPSEFISKQKIQLKLLEIQ